MMRSWLEVYLSREAAREFCMFLNSHCIPHVKTGGQVEYLVDAEGRVLCDAFLANRERRAKHE